MLLRSIILFLKSGSLFASCIGIGCQCTVSSSPVSFGNYNTLSATATDGTGNVQVICSALVVGLNVSYTIALNSGNGGSYTPRNMSFSSNHLNYNLYTDSARSIIWGNGTSTTQMVSDSYIISLLSVTRNYTVYGRIPALQTIVPGTYSDSILVTVTY